MTQMSRDPVLRRKLVRRPPPPDPSDPGAAGGVAARDGVRALARAVSDVAGLVAEGGERGRRRLTLAELLDSLDPDAFVAVLDGLPGGAGLVAMGQAGFAALVEAMTIGRLSSRAPAPRRATPTDAVLLAEVLGALFAALDAEDPLHLARVAQPVADQRLLPVLLDDQAYTAVTIACDLSAGGVRRPMRLLLALPAPPPDTDRAAPSSTAAAADADPAWSRAIEASVLGAPASLRAELGRLTLSLDSVLALGVGSALSLPLSALEEVQLVALDGTVQGQGRLGQSRGMRAIRLTSTPDHGTPRDGFDPARPASAAPLAPPEPPP